VPSSPWPRPSASSRPTAARRRYDPETGLHYNYFRHYDPETGRYTSPDPLGLAPAPNPVAYVDNPHSGCDPLGLMPKYTKEEKAQKRIDKIVDKKHADYHGDKTHGFTDERVLEILKDPDAVYQSQGQSGNFLFRKDNDIAVVYGPGAKQGQAITAYGESGIKGDSGAKALGGSPSDPGKPVTHEDVVEGRIPGKFGNLAPGVQIR
jgi:RHS repeat-associated protein